MFELKSSLHIMINEAVTNSSNLPSISCQPSLEQVDLPPLIASNTTNSLVNPPNANHVGKSLIASQNNNTEVVGVRKPQNIENVMLYHLEDIPNLWCSVLYVITFSYNFTWNCSYFLYKICNEILKIPFKKKNLSFLFKKQCQGNSKLHF